jgi:hypothetical protein
MPPITGNYPKSGCRGLPAQQTSGGPPIRNNTANQEVQRIFCGRPLPGKAKLSDDCIPPANKLIKLQLASVGEIAYNSVDAPARGRVYRRRRVVRQKKEIESSERRALVMTTS